MVNCRNLLCNISFIHLLALNVQNSGISSFELLHESLSLYNTIHSHLTYIHYLTSSCSSSNRLYLSLASPAISVLPTLLLMFNYHVTCYSYCFWFCSVFSYNASKKIFHGESTSFVHFAIIKILVTTLHCCLSFLNTKYGS